jgi:hypothetical protein
VVTTHDADNPCARGAPLLGVDLWEHAYYLDYFNERRHYVENVVQHLLDWDFAAENFRRAPLPSTTSAPPRQSPPAEDDPEREETERVYEVPIRSAL